MNLKYLLRHSLLGAISVILAVSVMRASGWETEKYFISGDSGERAYRARLYRAPYERSDDSYMTYEQLSPKAASEVSRSMSINKPMVHTLDILHKIEARVPIRQTTAWPHSPIGLLRAYFPGMATPTFSTATMVGPNHAITGGHCIFQHGYGWAYHVTFWPAKNGRNEPFSSVNAVALFSPSGWVKRRNPTIADSSNYDIGLVVLGSPIDRPIGNQTGWYSIYAPRISLLNSFYPPQVSRSGAKNYPLDIAGYPGDLPEGELQGTQMWYARDYLRGLRSNSVEYGLDTYPGQSGAVVRTVDIYDVVCPYCIGVHSVGRVPGVREEVVNRGARITIKAAETIVKWMSNTEYFPPVRVLSSSSVALAASLSQAPQSSSISLLDLVHRRLLRPTTTELLSIPTSKPSDSATAIHNKPLQHKAAIEGDDIGTDPTAKPSKAAATDAVLIAAKL